MNASPASRLRPLINFAVLTAPLVGLGATLADETAPPKNPDGIAIEIDDATKTVSYTPKLEWVRFDSRVYPLVEKRADGKRTVGLRVVILDPLPGQPTGIEVRLPEETMIVPVSGPYAVRSETGCRVRHTIQLDHQEALVRALAGAPTSELRLSGYRRPRVHTVTDEEREGFRRILSLWEMAELPMPEEPIPLEMPSAPREEARTAGITPPQNLRRTQPDFPALARRRHTGGRVIVSAMVRKDGSVGNIDVRESPGGDCGFEQATVEALRKWRYKPGTKDGEPVDVYFTIVIDFALGRRE